VRKRHVVSNSISPSPPVRPTSYQSTVLIIDDTPANLGVTVECLETQGLRVLIAQDGEEGLRRAELVRPDIILLDVMMPRMDGFEVCRRLKGMPEVRDTPVIFMTARSESREKILGFEVGGVDYVTKPIEINELRARVTTHLRLHAMQMQLAAQNAQLHAEIARRKEATEALEEQREGLEKQVVARTAELNQRNRQLQTEIADRERLQRALLAATDHEQRHLAQELHDGLGQDLAGLSMLMHGAMAEVTAGIVPSLTEMERMTLVVRNALKACRDIAYGLSPLTGASGGLVEALKNLQSRLGGPPGPILELNLDADCINGLGSESCDHLYRIAQEAAANAVKHANATRVTITLLADAQGLRLEISDDGRGIPSERSGRAGLGLHTMHDRASSIGGTVHLEANPTGGTTVVCQVPLFRERVLRKRKH
jgi:signal transduction histidine kinase